MQYLQHIKLDTFIIVSHGVRYTDWVITNFGLMNFRTGKIVNRIFNSGCWGYFINRRFRAESKLPTYPITYVIYIQEPLPF